MPETLETQVAKIQLSNPKQATTYVGIIAENATSALAELYCVIELPLFNPAAQADCERISNAVAGALRRSIRGEVTDTVFENAIAHINEELAKLSNIGQSNWVGKLSAIVAVKANNTLYITTTGKVIAMLLRDGELINLADSPKKVDPAKTFENFANGKITLKDMFLFSTITFFNYISLEKFKGMVKGKPLEVTAQTIRDTLEEAAGPEIAFGILLLNQVNPNSPIVNSSISLTKTNSWKNLIKLPKLKNQGVSLAKLKNSWSQKFMRLLGSLGRKTQPVTSEEPTKSRFEELGVRTKSFVESAKVRYSSRNKKIFLISAAILFIALIVNIFVTRHYKAKQQTTTATNQTLQNMNDMLSQAETSLSVNNRAKTGELLTNFASSQKNLPSSISSDQAKTLQEHYQQIIKTFDKQLEVSVRSLGDFSATAVISLPTSLLVVGPDTTTTIDKKTGSVTGTEVKCPKPPVAGIFWKDQKIFDYDGETLSVCDTSGNEASSVYAESVPAAHEFGGLTYYPSSAKLYVVNKAKAQIATFETNTTEITKTKAWATDPDLGNASGIAVDGSVYAYVNDQIIKFQSGKRAAFTVPITSTPLSGGGKIYTQADYANIYIFDKNNGQIVLLNKNGDLVNTIRHADLNSLVDFSVDEKNKTIYVLTNSKLLKVTY